MKAHGIDCDIMHATSISDVNTQDNPVSGGEVGTKHSPDGCED